jgi:hypothetical protein
MDRHARAAAEGIRQLEGYLLVQTERAAAQRAAEEFAAHLPWLAPEQREEVVRLYTAERMTFTRRSLEHVVRRCDELRGVYTERYAELRRRLLCRHLAFMLATVALGCAALWLLD